MDTCVLKDFVSTDHYYHLLLLHVGIGVCYHMSSAEANFAQQISEDFEFC